MSRQQGGFHIVLRNHKRKIALRCADCAGDNVDILTGESCVGSPGTELEFAL